MSKLFRRASRTAGSDSESPEVSEMRHNRRVRMRKEADGSGRSGPSLGFATSRPRDPLFYWKQNNLPFEFDDSEQMKRLRAYCRLVYAAHPIVGSCIDIYAKYPLLGMKLSCKDERLTEFYSDLFFDEEHGLNYDEFLVSMGREYWLVGEAWPLGTFNEALGVWDDEELLDPDNIEVQRSPFLRDPRYTIRLPEAMRELIRTRTPAWEYDKLMAAYPELAAYAADNVLMPVSNILLRQLKFHGGGPNAKRGVPLLYRGMRSLMQEEMLNAAVDAVADRLYTPLILAKLGASASDLGTEVPWIPTQDDLADFEEALDSALAADFRVITHHFGIDMAPVLGKEDMPDFTDDFDRIEGRILQVFGLSQTMLSGASSGETYAADALNRDLVTQLLTDYQKLVRRHYRQRALVVAEAQEHYDYETRGGQRFVRMEEVLEVDEETGEERIVEQPKLLIPEIEFRTMSLQDEARQTEFFEALREAGVPISMRTRLHNVSIDFDDEVNKTREEQIELAVEEQRTRKELYQRLRAEGLPIPADLRADFEPRALPEGQDPAMDMIRAPLMGLDPVALQPTLAPTTTDIAGMPPAGGVPVPGFGAQPVDAGQGDGSDGAAAGEGSAVPPESSEQRGGMPKPAALFKGAARMRALGRAYNAPVVYGPDSTVAPEHRRPHGRYGDPVHVGARRFLKIDAAVPLEKG
ncbi:hypothetical protein [Kitasatospora viridis]|nr:hypothetical protein [Kitasatospora viridis]